MNTKKVILRGPLTTQSGYGQHSRQIARWAFEHLQDKRNDVEIYAEVLPWGITPWITDVNADNGLIGRIYQATRPLPEGQQFDLSLQIQLPNEWNPFLAEYNVGITAAVETSICNPEWIDCLNRMDLVIVPSTFTKDVFVNTAKQFNKVIGTDIVVVPESFPDAFLCDVEETDRTKEISDFLTNQVTTNFNFVLFGQFTGTNPDNDRKNIPYTIKWFVEVFADNPNVGLIIKTNRGRNTTVDKTNTQTSLIQLLSQIKKPDSIGPKIYLLHGHLRDEELAAMYVHPKIKATISTTRGEGYGIPLLEAAAKDLPVMATNWSGHKDFLDKGKYIKFDYQLAPVHPSRIDNQIFIQGAQWANCDEADVKRKLRKFYESSTMPTQWAKELGTKIREEYSFNSIANKYSEVLNDVV